MIRSAVFLLVMLILMAFAAGWVLLDRVSGLWWRDVRRAVNGE